jgi:antitoxin MazE
MEAKVQKWGNSNGIRIPSSILKELGITVNDILSLKQEDNRIVIEKPKKKYSFNERAKKYKGDNLSKEFEWDEPRGKEIW